MGFEPIIDKDKSISKMLVRAWIFLVGVMCIPDGRTSGSQSGDIHTVDFTTGKTDLEYTQLLWKLASS